MLSRSAIAAASLAELPPAARGPLPGAGEARRRASRFDCILPAWARTEEAIALLEQIADEQPERTRVLTDPATFGYAGKAANRLRQLFDPFIIDRIDWAYRAGFDTPLFHKRRAAVFAYIDTHGPDALIAKVLSA